MYVLAAQSDQNATVSLRNGQMVACHRWLGIMSIQKCCRVTRPFFSSSSLFLGTSRTLGGPFFAPVVQNLSIPCRAAWFHM